MGDNKVMLPQRALFKELYFNPESETFGNALQSALKAGFKQEYAESIMNHGQKWVEEILRDRKMLQKAEEVLHEMLEMETETIMTTIDGAELRKLEPALVKIKQDTAKFVNERLNKPKWSNRTELTGKDGKDLPTAVIGFNYVTPDNADSKANPEATPSVE